MAVVAVIKIRTGQPLTLYETQSSHHSTPWGQHHLRSHRQQSRASGRARHRNPDTRSEEALGRGLGLLQPVNPLTGESD